MSQSLFSFVECIKDFSLKFLVLEKYSKFRKFLTISDFPSRPGRVGH